MSTRRTMWLASALIGVAAPGLVGVADAAADAPKTSTGPSSSQSPYLVPSARGVSITSVLTVGDAAGTAPNGTPYRMVGIPDGLGAYDNGNGTFTVLMNHELGADKGVVRAHGAAGAFVSKWIVRKRDLKVLSGQDLIQNLVLSSGTSTLARFCSADLAPVSAFYNSRTGKGYRGRIFMNGEETGNEGRAFAHLMNGTSYELPHLGKASFENQLANPASGDKTVVIGTDDTTPGQLYVYVGAKKSSGSPVDRAGLTGGTLFGVKVAGNPLEQSAAPFAKGTAFSLHSFGDVSAWTGAKLQAESVAAGVTEFLRPEDGAWDPRHPNDFYVNTTDKFDGHSRLWRLRFADISDPAAGGTLEAVLDGTEGQQMLDNLTISRNGTLILQEDPGNQPYLAKVWQYSIRKDRLTQVAAHDPARFTAGAPGFLTTDEESSGVLDVSSILGEGSYLLTTQAHYAISGELVEGGQLQLMRVRSHHDDD